jgi:glutamate---cysteine ligase / carboxylate-amine ligase
MLRSRSYTRSAASACTGPRRVLERRSGSPAPVADAVRASVELQPAVDRDEVQCELLQVQVEVATPVCRDLDEAGGHLLRLRHEVSRAAEQHGAWLVACGAAPWGEGISPVTDEARYRDIRVRVPALVDEQLINGMHVHVAVPTRGQGIEMVNRLRADLPLLVAASANSPYWRGRDTGFSSWRTVHYERWPVAGPPPHFADELGYDGCVHELLGAGVMRDIGQLYWQARVSARYPIVELRCPDVQLRVDDAVLIAGLTRALVMTALDDMRHDVPYPVTQPPVLRAASW